MEIGLGILSGLELSEVIESGLFGLLGLEGEDVASDWSDKEDLLSSSSEDEGIGGGVFTSFLINVEDGAFFGFTEGFVSGKFLSEIFRGGGV